MNPYSTFCSPIHPSVDIWFASTFWLLGIMLLWIWLDEYQFQFLLSDILSIHTEVELTDHILSIADFEELSYCFPQWLHHFTLLLSMVNNGMVYRTTHFVYPFTLWWAFHSFLPFVSSTAMDVCVQFFGWTSVCSSLGSVSRSGVVEPYDNCILIFLRIYQTIVHTGCTIFYLYKQCLRVPVSLHCCQHLIFFIIITILVYVK